MSGTKKLTDHQKSQLRIKHYKEYILTNLLNDLEPYKLTGIDQKIATDIDQILAQMADISRTIDKKIFQQYFSDNVENFRTLFNQWQYSEPKEKSESFRKWKEKKISMFKSFKEEMADLEKDDPQFKELKKEFQEIQDDSINDLHDSLLLLATDSKFRLLKLALEKFKKNQ